MNSRIPLNDQHCDALRKLFHLGVRSTSPLMSRILGEPVLLSIPAISLLTPEQAQQNIDSTGGHMCSVRRPFRGGLHGEAFFVFSDLEIARTAAGRNAGILDISGIEQDVVVIAGHIVLDACISALSRMLSHEFECQPPQLRMDNGKSIFQVLESDHSVMLLRVRFTFDHTQIEQSVMLVFGTHSFDALLVAAECAAAQLPLLEGPSSYSSVYSAEDRHGESDEAYADSTYPDLIVLDVDLNLEEGVPHHFTEEEIDIVV